MSDQYVLVGKTSVKCDNVRKWVLWMSHADLKIAETIIDDMTISTIFLGLNRRLGSGPPLLFETMVFGGQHDGDTHRYSTWEEAEEGHKQLCGSVMSDGYEAV